MEQIKNYTVGAVGAAVLLVLAVFAFPGRTASAAPTAATPISALAFCDTPSTETPVTLLVLGAAQTFSMTDYVMFNNDSTGANAVFFASSSDDSQYRLVVSTTPLSTITGSLATPLVFRGSDGNIMIKCARAGWVTVSGTLK